VTFLVRYAADARLAGRYELVTIFEALHDMSYPVDVLRAQAGGQLRDGARDGASRRAATCVVRFAYVLRACFTSIGH
jgi:hypothetical protein